MVLTNQPGRPPRRTRSPLIVDYLGRPLDPFGRLSEGVIRPEEDGWAYGTREMVCGIQSVTIPNTGFAAGDITPMSGRANDVDQSLLYPVASCLNYDDVQYVVPCTAPHHAVIVGHLDLTGIEARPSDDELRSRCEQLAATGAGMSGGARSYLGFEAPSWEAGSRMGNCTETIYDDAGAPTLQPGTA